MDLALLRSVNKGVWRKLGDGLLFLQLVLSYVSRRRSWKRSLPKIWTGNASTPRGLYGLSLESASQRNVATLSDDIRCLDTRRPTHVCNKAGTIGGRVRRVTPCYQVCRPQMLARLVFTRFVTSTYGRLFGTSQSRGLCS